MPNGDLLSRLRSGDVCALEELINKESAYLYTLARNLAGSVLAAEDFEEIVADVFSRLWNSREKLDSGMSINGYLITITRNLTIDRLRRGKIICLPLIEEISAEEDEIASTLERAELLQRLRRHIAGLQKQDKEILIRFYCYSQRTCELAKAVGLQHGALRTRLSRLRRKLKAALEEGDELYAKGN